MRLGRGFPAHSRSKAEDGKVGKNHSIHSLSKIDEKSATFADEIGNIFICKLGNFQGNEVGLKSSDSDVKHTVECAWFAAFQRTLNQRSSADM